MPKKHHNPTFRKPASSAHPSLASSSTPFKNGNHSPDTASPSVNDLIHHLRRTQATSHGNRDELIPTRTVHPSLKRILQVADTPPPRPRPGMRPIGSRSARGPAGPPPPTSWLNSSIHAPKHLRDGITKGRAQRMVPNRLDRLPGTKIPDQSSLLHQCLKSLARNWNWHVEYDEYYLATMPVDLKATLLSYIAVYGYGLTIDGLRTLFLNDIELDGATGSEETTHLDLAGFAITFKQLDQYFTKPPPTPAQPSTPPELSSWENSADTIHSLPLPTSPFPNLTHLSLSNPPPTITWPQLLSFAPNLATLTHLSLAHWPTPSLTPNAAAQEAKISSKYAPSPIRYGCSDFYSASDGDWSEAAGVLMRLSRATYCLKWLDLEGCGPWLEALSWEGEFGGGVEWCGGWRGVETIRAHAGWMPGETPTLSSSGKNNSTNKQVNNTQLPSTRDLADLSWDPEDEKRKYYHRQDVTVWNRISVQATAAEMCIRRKRRAVGGLWITVECDELQSLPGDS